MTFLADNSVDFVNFAYVLHEMPAENAKMIVKEIMRLVNVFSLKVDTENAKTLITF